MEVKENEQDGLNWKAPIQQRFEQSVPGGTVIAFQDTLYISGTYGMFEIGRRYGGGVAEITMRQTPYDVSRVEGPIRKRLEAHGYQVLGRKEKLT